MGNRLWKLPCTCCASKRITSHVDACNDKHASCQQSLSCQGLSQGGYCMVDGGLTCRCATATTCAAWGAAILSCPGDRRLCPSWPSQFLLQGMHAACMPWTAQQHRLCLHGTSKETLAHPHVYS